MLAPYLSKAFQAEYKKVRERVQSLVYFDDYESAEDEVVRFERWGWVCTYYAADQQPDTVQARVDTIWLAGQFLRDLLPQEAC